jgi:hypothetical protein
MDDLDHRMTNPGAASNPESKMAEMNVIRFGHMVGHGFLVICE